MVGGKRKITPIDGDNVIEKSVSSFKVMSADRRQLFNILGHKIIRRRDPAIANTAAETRQAPIQEASTSRARLSSPKAVCRCHVDYSLHRSHCLKGFAMKFVLAVILSTLATTVSAQQAEVVRPGIRPPPPAVVAYVKQQPLPANPVMLSEKVIVGEPLPDNLVLTPLPDAPRFSYVVINQQRVIVDTDTLVVMQLVD
jgi:hypothetical protein